MKYDNLLEFQADTQDGELSDKEIIAKLLEVTEKRKMRDELYKSEVDEEMIEFSSQASNKSPILGGFDYIALIWAVKTNRSELLAYLLLNYDIDISETTMLDKTAVQIASDKCYWGCVNVIAQYFVDHPDKNIGDKGRLRYALNLARKNKQSSELIETLKEAVTRAGTQQSLDTDQQASSSSSKVNDWRKQPVSGSQSTVASQMGFAAYTPGSKDSASSNSSHAPRYRP